MILIPRFDSCTIIAEDKFCNVAGAPHEIVAWMFLQEIIIDEKTSIIAPRVREVTIVGDDPVAELYRDMFVGNGIQARIVCSASPLEVFGVESWNEYQPKE